MTLDDAVLNDMLMRRTSMRGTRVRGARLYFVSLGGADLTGADFTGTTGTVIPEHEAHPSWAGLNLVEALNARGASVTYQDLGR